MNGITVPMALIDFIPVILFFIAAVILQRDLYNKMVKGAFALLATGSVMVLISGIMKALWKILYALNICDYTVLNTSFFPMQGPGFLLVFLALIGMFTQHKKEIRALSVGVVPVYSSNLPFILMQTIGCAGVQGCLFLLSKRMKKPTASIMYVVSFVTMLGMGYLSAKFDNSSNMHWVAQGVNIISWASFLWGTMILHKAGLNKENV